MQNEDGLDDIISFLNANEVLSQKFNSAKLKKQQFDISTSKMNETQNFGLKEEDAFEFQQVYEKRLEKIQRKNQEKDEKQLRKKLMLEKAQKIVSEVKIRQKDESIKLFPIRHLVFKPFSGNHLAYQIKDNGYKFKFTNGVVALVKHLLEQNGFIESTNNEAHIIWNIGVAQPSVYQTMGAYMKINHFPKTFQITRKDLMLQNLSKMRSKYPLHYNFYPKTFILPNQAAQFMDQCQKDKKINKWYIVKPSNKSQGKGIWLSDKPEEILQKQKESIVVCQYVSNPLLVNGLKFDMRIYVGITCYNPLRVYIYENGLARFATSAYFFDPSTKENLLTHLTNYSLNKFSQNFVANDEELECKGHKWSLLALKEYFRKSNIDATLVWARIEDLIIKTIISIENKVFSAMELSVPYRDNCFQILGFDILIDEGLRPWLLEINLSPSLNTDSNLDLTIKGAMLSDMFTMMGVVSLDQRFSFDKTYLLNQNKASSKTLKNDYPKLQKLVIAESEEEQKRSRGWKKIFPTETASKYKQFFDIDRPLNRLLREEELKKFKLKNSGANFNQFIKQLNENSQMDKIK